LDGFLEAKEDGYYVIYLVAVKGSKLYIGDKLLIDWADNYTGQYYSYLLPLSKGFYPVRIEYFSKKANFNLMLGYLTPSKIGASDPIQIPWDVLYRTGNK